MVKIAVLIHEGFEDSEYTDPVKAFKNAGHECVNKGDVVHEKKTKHSRNHRSIVSRCGQSQPGF